MRMTRGAMLRRARQRAGRSQAWLAERVGVDPATISRYEREEIPVPDDVMARAGWELRAPELLLIAGVGPFAAWFDDDIHEALDWLEEEAKEAVEAMRRIARAVRRGEQPDPADAEQVVDLGPTLMAALGALSRVVDIVAVIRSHEAKLARYMAREVVA